MSALTGREKFYIFGNKSQTTATINDFSEFLGVDGKVDKVEVHKFLNSHEIKSWFGKQPDLDKFDAGIHFVNADESGVSNAPSSGIYKVTQYNIDGYVLQEAERFSTGERFTRAKIGTLWGGWNQTGGKEVTPPSDLPIGKEGQMLMYTSGKWKSTSPVEIASSLHINHDQHFELPVTDLVVSPSDRYRLKAGEIDKVEWMNLSNTVELAFIRFYDGISVKVGMLLRSFAEPKPILNLTGLGYSQTRGSVVDRLMGYRGQIGAVTDPDLGSLYYVVTSSDAPYNKDGPVYFDGTFTIIDDMNTEDEKRTFIDCKFKKSPHETKMYIKLRTRMDFQPYFEPPPNTEPTL